MIGYENGAAVEAIDFQFPDEGDEPTPVVRDAWRAEPLLDKCQRRFAPVAGGQPIAARSSSTSRRRPISAPAAG